MTEKLVAKVVWSHEVEQECRNGWLLGSEPSFEADHVVSLNKTAPPVYIENGGYYGAPQHYSEDVLAKDRKVFLVKPETSVITELREHIDTDKEAIRALEEEITRLTKELEASRKDHEQLERQRQDLNERFKYEQQRADNLDGVKRKMERDIGALRREFGDAKIREALERIEVVEDP